MHHIGFRKQAFNVIAYFDCFCNLALFNLCRIALRSCSAAALKYGIADECGALSLRQRADLDVERVSVLFATGKQSVFDAGLSDLGMIDDGDQAARVAEIIHCRDLYCAEEMSDVDACGDGDCFP